jgi:subtilisin family serine protease
MAGYASESAYVDEPDIVEEDTRIHGAEAGRATHIVLMRAAQEGVRSTAAARNTLNELFSLDGVQPDPSGHSSGTDDLMLALGVLPVVASAEGVRSASMLTGVEAVYPNRLRRLAPPTEMSSSFHSTPGHSLQRTAAEHQDTSRQGHADSAVHSAPSAWNSIGWNLLVVGVSPGYAADGASVTVAVLDTGLDLLHPDVQGRDPALLETRCFVSGTTVQDGNGHGTHCAGVLVGADSQTGERLGLVPGAKLMVGKVLSDDGLGFDNDIINGVAWAFLGGARVVSLSLCSDRRINEPGSEIYERLATRLMQGNSILIAAAGNASKRPHSHAPVGDPACCPSIVSVGAIGPNSQIAPFSPRRLDHGAIDVVAPGVGIKSWAAGGGYRLMSGTSMACPHAAGVTALLSAAFPSATARDVRDMLLASALRQGHPDDYGAGVVQAP